MSQSKRYRIVDPIREKATTLTPEEGIRQTLIKFMIRDLEYPAHLFAVEKTLHSLNVSSKGVPPDMAKKRIDLLVFSPEGDFLRPLILGECKAHKLNKKALLQIISYNTYIKAPVIILCNGTDILMGVLNPQKRTFVFRSGLPTFHNLLKIRDSYAVLR
ncbi:MAG: type I restriction enzyme HsdR N-terminal domain-containing protein [Victivallaceae bacterium]